MGCPQLYQTILLEGNLASPAQFFALLSIWQDQRHWQIPTFQSFSSPDGDLKNFQVNLDPEFSLKRMFSRCTQNMILYQINASEYCPLSLYNHIWNSLLIQKKHLAVNIFLQHFFVWFVGFWLGLVCFFFLAVESSQQPCLN